MTYVLFSKANKFDKKMVEIQIFYVQSTTVSNYLQ